jgi:diguanylate cyclase (GGDEF)-like protein
MLLLALYVALAPELRFITLLGWFVALLFMAGLGGFRAVVGLSALMCVGYFLVVVFVESQGYPLSLTFEAGVSGSVFVIGVYAGFVFERLRSDRQEMRELRRRLSQMALTDALTQLPNRRHFEDVLRAELDRVRRYGGRCAVAMVDVDWFKHYNDSVGHLAGDTLLRELADVMRRELRLHDMVARFGGEEFALIMINTSKADALLILERLRIDVQEHPFRHRDIQPVGRVTVSAGLACFPEDGTTYDDLLKSADDALYAAKRAGRNQICLAEERVGDTVP